MLLFNLRRICLGGLGCSSPTVKISCWSIHMWYNHLCPQCKPTIQPPRVDPAIENTWPNIPNITPTCSWGIPWSIKYNGSMLMTPCSPSLYVNTQQMSHKKSEVLKTVFTICMVLSLLVLWSFKIGVWFSFELLLPCLTLRDKSASSSCSVTWSPYGTSILLLCAEHDWVLMLNKRIIMITM